MEKQIQNSLLLLAFISTILVFSQKPISENDKFSQITLLVNHDRKKVDKQVQIQIYNRKNNTEVFVRTLDSDDCFKDWVYIKPEIRFYISKAEYNTIVKCITAMDFNQFFKLNSSFPLHGYQCELEYGDRLNSIALKAWSPTNDTEKRKLQDYLDICNMVFDLAKIENLSAQFKK